MRAPAGPDGWTVKLIAQGSPMAKVRSPIKVKVHAGFCAKKQSKVQP
jgi:hypothetical protein